VTDPPLDAGAGAAPDPAAGATSAGAPDPAGAPLDAGAAPDPAASLAGERLGDLLESLAARTPAPGGGSAAGIVLALAAALCAMAARFSARLAAADEIAATADRLRQRAIHLAAEDSLAYAGVLQARRLRPGTDPALREEAIAAAMAQAVAVPLEISEIGAEVARLATEVASAGNPNLLGDALTAVLLAEAAAAAAATLVEINVSDQGG
jgi:formiminotetrahydrofolate cyclodeaminase